MAISFGANFRATLAYVTDPAGTAFCDITDLYPTTNGETFGWVSSGPSQERDRSTSVNARLAGVEYTANSGSAQKTWRLDLDAANSKDITLALGDQGSAQTNLYCRFYDDTTTIATVNPGNTSAGQFYDANGTLRTTAANWVSNNTTLNHTFSSTIFKFVIGQPTSSTGNTSIAHVAVADAAGSGTTVNATLSTSSSSTHLANVNAVKHITASLATSSTATYQAAIRTDTAIFALLGTSATSTFQAGVNAEKLVSATLSTSASTGHQATITTGIIVLASAATSSTSTYQATITAVQNISISAGLATSSSTTYQATVVRPLWLIEPPASDNWSTDGGSSTIWSIVSPPSTNWGIE